MLWAESEGVRKDMPVRGQKDAYQGCSKNRPGRDRNSSMESHRAQGGVGIGVYEPLTPWSTGAMSKFGWKHLCVAVYRLQDHMEGGSGAQPHGPPWLLISSPCNN